MALLEPLQDELPGVEGYVVMTDREHMPETNLKGAISYEELIEGSQTQFAWPDLDERAAASLCYTSGTTGNPRGALFTHRSTVLHSFAIALPEILQPLDPVGHDAGRAHVPRQRLGPALCLPHDGRQAGAARPALRRRGGA